MSVKTFVVLFGTIISGLIALVIIGVSVWAAVQPDSGGNVPKIFENWGGVIIGFYFGSFTTLVSELLGGRAGGSPQQAESGIRPQ